VKAETEEFARLAAGLSHDLKNIFNGDGSNGQALGNGNLS